MDVEAANGGEAMQKGQQKITPNLWFDRQAEEAVNFYVSAFKNASVGDVTRASGVGFEVTGLREGTAMTVDFELEGLRFIALNGGPLFKFNPSVSFLVACDSAQEVEALWAKLSAGGSALMPLGEYPFSPKYGWTQDRYGLSWQVMHRGERPITQKITPTLMFVGPQAGKAEEAVRFYASVFKSSRVGDIMRYGAGQAPDREGTVAHAAFTLEGQEFAAMDSAREHMFAFNEAISLIVDCGDQKEVDYFWSNLTTNGGQEGRCGWLKDRFGFSWQVVPTLLGQMLRDPDKQKVARVTGAFLKMNKLDVAELKKAFNG
jgi:predicted 3-demethylubiquinone-9 3-methyltransferase (glyoxalase superfamily)